MLPRTELQTLSMFAEASPSWASKPPVDFIHLEGSPCPDRLRQLKMLGQQQFHQMRDKYPALMQKSFNGKIVYMLRTFAPETVLKHGGFTPKDPDLWLSNTGSGSNRGSICFSVLPEVTTLFCHEATLRLGLGNPYIYAVPLFGDFLLPGGAFRQIISPGAFALPSWWMAREVKEMTHDGQILLGPPQGQWGRLDSLAAGERFDAFLEGRLIKPVSYEMGEDYDPVFEIADTAYSKQFQEAVDQHYRAQKMWVSNCK